MTEHIVRTLSSQVYFARGMMEQPNEHDLRHAYLFASKLPNFKEIMLESAMQIYNNVITALDEKEGDNEEYQLLHNEKLYNLQTHLLIGRMDWCDVKFDVNDRYCSRIHGIVFLTPKSVVIVDVGSLLGINTIERSSIQPNEKSVINMRKALIFSREETAVIQMGSQRITLNPKKIVV